MKVFDFFKKGYSRVKAPRVEVDANGNIFYLSSIFGERHRNKLNYDMSNLFDKHEAAKVCTPLAMVLEKLSSMIQRGILYVTDKEGNDVFDAWKDFLLNPNPFQTFSAFIKNVEYNLCLFGFCPIIINRGMSNMPPVSMWVVRPELFHIQGTGKLYKQFDYDEIVDKAWIDNNGQRIYLGREDYFVIHSGQINFSSHEREIYFSSSTDSLSSSVSGWIASMSASHVLMTNGGPKGVLFSDNNDVMGNTIMTSEEKDELHRQFNAKYGIVSGKSPIFISPKKLGWLPMDYNADQLKLREFDERCTANICNVMRLNTNLFTDAKYDNQESAKKSAYQDVIIPDSKIICESISKAILPDDAIMTLDFSDVECLQKSKSAEAATLNTAAGAIRSLLEGGMITLEEARRELESYIDIDPDELKVKQNE